MEDSYKHKGMRKQLTNLLLTKGIHDEKVLNALNKVPRHFFFEDAFLEHAYQDKAFPIGEGQTISQPFTVAYQTMLLNINKGDTVLEIGTGSGYQCCILMEMGAKVYTVEINQVLHLKARKLLELMNYKPYFYFGDGSKGLRPFAPYDKIIVTAGAPDVPTELINQLKDNGVLVIPVGTSKTQKMLRLTKHPGNKIYREEFDNFSFVPLVGEYGWKH